jgi:hypothetical protein
MTASLSDIAERRVPPISLLRCGHRAKARRSSPDHHTQNTRSTPKLHQPSIADCNDIRHPLHFHLPSESAWSGLPTRIESSKGGRGLYQLSKSLLFGHLHQIKTMSSAFCRLAVTAVLLGSLLGCRYYPVVWKHDFRSPDGAWIATARTDQWGGFGSNVG